MSKVVSRSVNKESLQLNLALLYIALLVSQETHLFYVWNTDPSTDEDLDDLLSTIAYDLEFYNPNEAIFYYGDDRLKNELRNGINELRIFLAS